MRDLDSLFTSTDACFLGFLFPLLVLDLMSRIGNRFPARFLCLAFSARIAGTGQIHSIGSLYLLKHIPLPKIDWYWFDQKGFTAG